MYSMNIIQLPQKLCLRIMNLIENLCLCLLCLPLRLCCCERIACEYKYKSDVEGMSV